MNFSSEATFPLLKRVIERSVDDLVIDYLVDYVCKLFKLSSDASERADQSTPAGTPKSLKSRKAKNTLPRLHEFIHNISVRSKCTMSTMLVTLIYLQRLAGGIGSSNPTGMKPCSRHRVVFAAIMIAHKIWNDCSMVGKHWAEVSNMFKSNEVLTMEREILLLLNYNLELTTEEIWQVARPFMTAPYMKVSKSEAMSVDLCFHLLALQKTQFGSHSGHSTSPTQPPAAISVLHQATDSPLVVTPDSIHPFSSLQPLTAHPSQTHPAASSLLVSDSICVSPTKLGNPITQSASTVGYQPLPRSSKMLSTVRRSSDVRDLEKPQNPPVSTRPGTHRLSPSPRLRKRQCVEPNKLRKASYTLQPYCVNRNDHSSTTSYISTTSNSSSSATTPSYTSPLVVPGSPLVWYAQLPPWYDIPDAKVDYVDPIAVDNRTFEHSSKYPFPSFGVEND